ncbi:outer membrane protein assembly factor BamA [Melittangium boletus]|uniref:Outer membrane protein assembly factor BamA n=1 Tax=Melittangium boletus DSM 14713 TaxID=1294270 RepID=A0A250IL99_9BACT|nr:outer membrane protein assembly factor BamA [Melittangium boletus]ATB32524.1 outer membrane protein assembly factor YaeT precursor [Melittangium boletus DSM 14713]
MPGHVLAQEGGESPPAAPAPAPPPSDAPVDADREVREGEVTDIRIEGNRRVESEAIRRVLRTQVGTVFDPARTPEDLRAVWALGYFSDVQLLVQRLPSGGVTYVVRVQERPSIRAVKLAGNDELSQDDLKESIEVKALTILDLDAVRRTQKKIQEKYIDKGYFLAEVGHKIVPVEGGQVDVVFNIDENSKVMVKDIIFLGAEKVPASRLKEVMLTKEGGYLSFITGEGTYREEVFQRDLAVIQATYYDEGFINVRVDKPSVSLSPDKRYIYITLKVTEGERYDIGKIGFSGDLVVPEAELSRLMTSSTGQHFSRTQLGQDIQSVTDVYYDRGYAYANINPITNINADARTVDLTFEVQKGPQVTIERIEVVGNSKTRDKVIRRELRVYEGELFNGTGMRRSKERVTALGFFESVEVTQKPGSRDDTIAIQVEVKEKATGTFQVGLGFSNVENFIFTAQVSQNNFLGWGQSVSASAQISSLRSLVQLSYFDPYFLDTRYLLSADFFRVEADYGNNSFIRQSTGGNLSLGYQVLEDLLVNVGYSQEHVSVAASPSLGGVLLANRFLSGVTSSARLSVTYDKRNNRLFPSKGFIHYGSVEYAPSFLGGSFLFARYTAYSRLYFPLPLGAVFKTNATIGYIQPLDTNRPLPISELYYLGGINSLRGYFLRSISPNLSAPSSSSPDAVISRIDVGGNKQLILNLELEFPVFEKAGIRGVVFYDAGNAYASNERFFQDKQDKIPLGLFQSVGFGFRWFSPVGPLRFEWGIPLTRRADDQPILFEFTIGNFF